MLTTKRKPAGVGEILIEEFMEPMGLTQGALDVLLRSFHPDVSAFPERVIGSACALSFSRLARRSLALRPAHSRCHQFVTR
jgi:plasmid maintenance system antidote protein VapI